MFNVTQYKDVLFSFFPIVYVLAPSYTGSDVIEKATIHPVIFSPMVYQLIFSIVIVFVGCFIFRRKEL